MTERAHWLHIGISVCVCVQVLDCVIVRGMKVCVCVDGKVRETEGHVETSGHQLVRLTASLIRQHGCCQNLPFYLDPLLVVEARGLGH